MRRALLPSAAIVALVLLALAGCGGDDDATDTTSAVEADVVATASDELKWEEDGYTATAGEVTIELVNPGALPHTLLIDGEDFKLETDGGDDSDSDTIELEAGTYTVYCDVAGHQAAGMEAELEVS